MNEFINHAAEVLDKTEVFNGQFGVMLNHVTGEIIVNEESKEEKENENNKC